MPRKFGRCLPAGGFGPYWKASDAPRWQVMGGLKVIVEEGTGARVIDELRSRGHDVCVAGSGEFGGAQMIYRLDGGYLAASDHRKDGQGAAY